MNYSVKELKLSNVMTVKQLSDLINLHENNLRTNYVKKGKVNSVQPFDTESSLRSVELIVCDDQLVNLIQRVSSEHAFNGKDNKYLEIAKTKFDFITSKEA